MDNYKIEVKLDSEGIQELLKSQEVIDCLYGYAGKVAKKSNGKVKRHYIGKTRANVSVEADNTDNSLLKSL